MLEKRRKGLGWSLPSRGCPFGLTNDEWQGSRNALAALDVRFGNWTKAEIIYLLKNKINPLTTKEGDTCVECPEEREEEVIQIFKEQFGKLIFGETERGRLFIAVDGGRHVLVRADKYHTLLLHLR